VNKGHRGKEDYRAKQDPLDRKAQKALKVRREMLDLEEMTDFLEHQEPTDLMEPRER
jgi:hypothetical protein